MICPRCGHTDILEIKGWWTCLKCRYMRQEASAFVVEEKPGPRRAKRKAMMSRGVTFFGRLIVLQTDYLRVTQNPRGVPDSYPKTGDVVLLKGHSLLPDGTYLVTMITEYEPAFSYDKLIARDVRFSVRSSQNQVFTEMNGPRFLAAIVEIKKLEDL